MSERTRTAPSRSGPKLRRLRIRVIEGPDKGLVLEPEHAVVAVGSASDNDIVLGDETVSRYHVELRPQTSGIAVADLGSLNGTFVGPTRVDNGAVSLQTSLRLGNTVLRLEEGAAVEAPADETVPQIEGLVGQSAAMREVCRKISRIAGAETSTLIIGESGTGKEVVAEAIHRLSPRAHAPFEIVDCGSLPAGLIASELFGHEKGAFTGADQQHTGAFERADGGTLFLDEIGELPTALQPTLLGVVERQRFRRVGGRKEIAVDVRLLTATNRDLRAEVNTGRFRLDLYYRLAVTRIAIPPLRDRPEDIEPLVEHFVREISGSSVELLASAETLESLRRQRWSGNVRELRNVIEATAALGRLSLEQTATSIEKDRSYREARAAALAKFERSFLGELIERHDGNASRAARAAKMDRPYLLSLLRRHGLR